MRFIFLILASLFLVSCASKDVESNLGGDFHASSCNQWTMVVEPGDVTATETLLDSSTEKRVQACRQTDGSIYKSSLELVYLRNGDNVREKVGVGDCSAVVYTTQAKLYAIKERTIGIPYISRLNVRTCVQ